MLNVAWVLGGNKVANRIDRSASTQRLFWPTVGLMFFLLIWLGLCTAGFWYLYVSVTAGFSSPESTLTALQWTTWPFVVLCVAGPLLVILSIGGLRVVRDLLQMQKLIINLPTQLESMQTVLTEFKALRAQMITDVSRVRGDDNNDTATVQDRPTTNGSDAFVREFMELYEDAKDIFYPALEEYNARGGEPLIVQRGGANFGEITEALGLKREFDTRSVDNNRKIAAFVSKAFELERQTRRYRSSILTPKDVEDLRRLRSEIRNRARIKAALNSDPVQPNA